MAPAARALPRQATSTWRPEQKGVGLHGKGVCPFLGDPSKNCGFLFGFPLIPKIGYPLKKDTPKSKGKPTHFLFVWWGGHVPFGGVNPLFVCIADSQYPWPAGSFKGVLRYG